MTDPNRDRLLEHDADGIREFDNALPRWWLYGFYLTIVFAVVYMVNYHVLPDPWFGERTVVAEWEADVAEAAVRHPRPAAVFAPITVSTDADTLARGEAVFAGMRNLCHTCHRADLGGIVGPNLTDGFWMHGCGPDDIAASIRTGYPLKGMLAYGSGQPLTEEEVQQLVSFIVSKLGSNPPSPKAIDPTREVECR